jgi:hypothetical protein
LAGEDAVQAILAEVERCAIEAVFRDFFPKNTAYEERASINNGCFGN